MGNIGTLNGLARVAVVDDDEDMRLFLKDVLQSGNTFTFAGGFSSGKQALRGIPRLQPDLALMDIKLADMDGAECTTQLKRLVPNLKVVILSGNRDADSFERSRAAGALTYLIKPVDPDQLVATLRLAFIPAKLMANSKVILNPREKAVLAKLADGLLYKEISDALGISYAAVHKCQHKLFKKLGVTNRSEAMRVWLQNRNNSLT